MGYISNLLRSLVCSTFRITQFLVQGVFRIITIHFNVFKAIIPKTLELFLKLPVYKQELNRSLFKGRNGLRRIHQIVKATKPRIHMTRFRIFDMHANRCHVVKRFL